MITHEKINLTKRIWKKLTTMEKADLKIVTVVKEIRIPLSMKTIRNFFMLSIYYIYPNVFRNFCVSITENVRAVYMHGITKYFYSFSVRTKNVMLIY